MWIATRQIAAIVERRLPGWIMEERLQGRAKSAVWRIGRDDDLAALKCLPLWFQHPQQDMTVLRDHPILRDTPTVVRCRTSFEETIMRGARTIGFVMMDWYPTSLRDLARQRPPTGEHDIRPHLITMVTLCQQLLDETGMVHWDLKPGNVLINPDNGAAVLGDYGGMSVLKPGVLRCQYTEKFASPERVMNLPHAGVASLSYTIGLTAFWLIAGRVPYEDLPVLERLDALAAHGPDFDDASACMAGGLVPFIARCLAPQPADRYPDFRAMLATLDA